MPTNSSSLGSLHGDRDQTEVPGDTAGVGRLGGGCHLARGPGVGPCSHTFCRHVPTPALRPFLSVPSTVLPKAVQVVKNKGRQQLSWTGGDGGGSAGVWGAGRDPGTHIGREGSTGEIESHPPRGLANCRLSKVVFNTIVIPFKEQRPNPSTEF